MSIDDLFDISQLRRHPPTEKTCWVCAKPWARYDSPRAQQGARDRHGFPKYPVIVLPIKAHLQRIAPEVENVPAQIAVCFECFNQYATIYHHVVADDVDPRLGMNG